MERGQIFSLDFLISMVVITAAIALLIQATEFNTYNMKEERTYNEMRNVARIASNMIIASNETTCEDGIGGLLMNCVETSNITAITAFDSITKFLDDSGYGYEIKTSGEELSRSSVHSYNNQDFVDVNRLAFVNDLSGDPEDITVKVWKA